MRWRGVVSTFRGSLMEYHSIYLVMTMAVFPQSIEGSTACASPFARSTPGSSPSATQRPSLWSCRTGGCDRSGRLGGGVVLLRSTGYACFPRHGPGPKHKRQIVLTDWQREIALGRVPPTTCFRKPIQSDGWRGTNRIAGRYEYPRGTSFSTVRQDIRELFQEACRRMNYREPAEQPVAGRGVPPARCGPHGPHRGRETVPTRRRKLTR